MKVFNYTNTGVLKSSTSGSSGGAPTNAEYAVFASNGTLTNEVLLTDGSATGDILTQGEIGYKDGNDFTTLSSSYIMHRKVSDSLFPLFLFNRAQDNAGNADPVAANDVLGRIIFAGYSSTGTPAYRSGVQIDVTATGAPGSTATPAKMEVKIAPNASSSVATVLQVETGKVGINATTIDSGAAFQIDSTTGAFYPPTMTTVQRDALSGVDSRALIYNNSLAKFQGYENGSWKSLINGVAGLCEGRLTLTTGVPITTSDVTGAGTIYFTPYKGNGIGLYDGTNWIPYEFSQISLALSVTNGTVHDVFIYDNSGTLTLELTAWTNATTRTTAITLQNGVYVKSGATTRLYLGTLYASGTNTCEDSVTKRFLWNNYNRIRRPMLKQENTDSWAANTSSAFRSLNGSTVNRVEFVIGVSEDLVEADSLVMANFNTVKISAGVGIDSTTVSSAGLAGQGYSTVTANHTAHAFYKGYPGIGYHYAQALEWSSANVNFLGDDGLTGFHAGIQGTIES